MSFNYMALIEKYGLNYQLIINENSYWPVYTNLDLKDTVIDLTALNGNVVSVKKIKKINNNFYHLLYLEGESLGWSTIENSMMVIQTPNRTLRISEAATFDNKINKLLKLDQKVYEDYKGKILKTETCVILDGEIFYALKLKDKLIAYINQKYLYFFINDKSHIKFNKDRINLFKNSKLNEISSSGFNVINIETKMIGVFEELNVARISINKKTFWIDLKDTNHTGISKKILTIEEVILDSIFFQLKDKLKVQNRFTAEKVSELTSQIKKQKAINDKNTMIIRKIKDMVNSEV